MPAINPIQSPMPPITPQRTGSTGATGNADGKVDFSRMLENYVNKVNTDQQVSAVAIQDLLSGKSQDIIPTVTAMAKADLSFKLLIGVRNKVIEAYKQTMNMQV